MDIFQHFRQEEKAFVDQVLVMERSMLKDNIKL